MDPIRKNRKKLVGTGVFSRKNSFVNIPVPTYIFKNRKFGILEAVIVYLKEEKNLKFREIARILQRDERNVATLYHRAKKKEAAK
mgnify:CR=1 FL=1